MELNEAYQKNVEKGKSDLKGKNWTKAILDIERYEGPVNFSGIYFNNDNTKKDIEVSFGIREARAIQTIHRITTTVDSNNRWNRLKLTLYSDDKLEKEFIWDQSIQDSIEKYKA